MAKTKERVNRAHTFEVGERVFATSDLPEQDLVEGELGEVVAVNGDKYTILVGDREVRVRGRNLLRA